MWDLVPGPGIELRPPVLEVWSLGHYTAREVPGICFWSSPWEASSFPGDKTHEKEEVSLQL